jgi:hypothetical protein
MSFMQEISRLIQKLPEYLLYKSITHTEMAETWQLGSWRKLPIKQQPQYPDAAKLEAALEEGVFVMSEFL